MADPRNQRLTTIAARLRDGTDESAWQALSDLLTLLGPAAEARLRQLHLAPTEIEDALADTTLRLFERRRRIDPGRSLAGYFLAVARSQGIRQLARRTRPLSDPIAEIAAADERQPTTGDLRHAALRRAVADLDDEDARVLQAYAQSPDDRSWTATIASELGLDGNAVRVRKSRALQKLRRILDSLDLSVPHPDPEP